MSLFALGDTHLSLGTDKPMDVFYGWSDYVERLKKNWNAVVSEKDTVVLAGDISWAMKLDECYADFNFINSLNGSKIIVKGNHDYWWNTMKKMNAYLADNDFDSIKILYNNAYRVGDISVCGTRGWFFDAENDTDRKTVLREAQRLRTSIETGLELGGEPVVFLHYPPISVNEKCEEIYSVLLEYKIKRCYFGHLHAQRTAQYASFESDSIKFGLISADFLSFCPKLIEKF